MQIVISHKSTDFDSLASMVAATLLYPKAKIVLPRNINPNVKAFISIHKDIFPFIHTRQVSADKVTRLIVVDTSQWRRIERIDGFDRRRDMEILLWDHHDTEGDIAATWCCKEKMGATITLMIRRLREEKKILTPVQSTLFLAGLYEDTGNLTFPSSQAEDAYAAAYLMERKADLTLLNSFLRPAYGEKQKTILFEMLQSAKREKVNGYNVSLNAHPVRGHVHGLSVVVHMYREIVNVDAAFGIFSDTKRDVCMIIGRSRLEELNIGTIMRSLGGGGHPGAGSAQLKGINPEAAGQMIRDLIIGNQQASVQISDLMSFPVFTVTPDTTMEEVALLLRAKGCTGVPVVDDGKVVGMISRRDFTKVRQNTLVTTPVKAFMMRDIKTITPGSSPMLAARLMVKHDIGRLPVVEDGRIIGIVSRSDVMTYFYDLLPD